MITQNDMNKLLEDVNRVLKTLDERIKILEEQATKTTTKKTASSA